MPAASDDELILVDDSDRIIGFADPRLCHAGTGLLHRAVSIFIFNYRGEVLIQQRSARKPLWPLYWSTSCCGHPRRNESYRAAAQRRLHEELGLSLQLKRLFRFSYHAAFDVSASERELCVVFGAQSQTVPTINAEEINNWCYLDPDQLSSDLETRPDIFTPWLRREWQLLQNLSLPAKGQRQQDG